MRFLVVGAGATGGYFGGRLLEAGRDVTFLVRPGRAAQLAAAGLAITSPAGDASLPSPPTVLASDLRRTVRRGDPLLQGVRPRRGDRVRRPGGGAGHGRPAAPERHAPPRRARRPVRPGPSPGRVVLHLGEARRRRGGWSTSATSTGWRSASGPAGGRRGWKRSPRPWPARSSRPSASDRIVLEMWEKWVFLAALAGITCLTRSAVGDIVAAGGADLAAALLEECRSDRRRRGPPAPPRVASGGPRPAHRPRLGGDRLDAGGR